MVTPESIAVVGPTASGKTRRAVALARRFGGEIISADSRQVYRGMTIGTGKDLGEYGEIPYHLIDIRPAGDKYNLHDYLSDFHTAYGEVLSRGRMPVICGGTGMYVEQALRGIRLPEVGENPALRESLAGKSLDELAAILREKKELHNVTDIDTRQRAIRAIEIAAYYEAHPEEAALTNAREARPLDSLIIGIDIPREERRKRISARLHARLEEGMVEEVKALLEGGVAPEDLIYYGLEYKFVTLHLTGALSYEEMVGGLEIAIHQFAKRQMTWFRGMERRGLPIRWLPFDMGDGEFISEVERIMGK